jgi:hypothetical protein
MNQAHWYRLSKADHSFVIKILFDMYAPLPVRKRFIQILPFKKYYPAAFAMWIAIQIRV